MGQPSFSPDDRSQLQWCVEQLRELNRKRPRRGQNIGDLQNVRGYGALSGHALMYDQLTGQWKPVLSPPVVTFNINGPLTVVATDEMPMGSAGRVIQAAARLKTSGSTTTTAILKHTTGATTSTLGTFTFTSGNKNPSSYPTISFVFAQYDVLWLDVTAAGTGAGGLVVPVWTTAP